MWENVKKKKDLFICFVLSYYASYVLNSVLFFVLISSCLQKKSCLIYVICVFLRIVMSNTYCVLFFRYFSSFCVLYVAVLCFYLLRLVYPMLPCCVCIYFVLLTLCCQFSGLSIFDCPYLSIRSKDDVLFRVLIKYMNKELELKKYRTYKILRH